MLLKFFRTLCQSLYSAFLSWLCPSSQSSAPPQQMTNTSLRSLFTQSSFSLWTPNSLPLLSARPSYCNAPSQLSSLVIASTLSLFAVALIFVLRLLIAVIFESKWFSCQVLSRDVKVMSKFCWPSLKNKLRFCRKFPWRTSLSWSLLRNPATYLLAFPFEEFLSHLLSLKT